MNDIGRFAPVPPVRPGDRVAVVAPASPFDHAELERGIEALETRFEVVVDGIYETKGFLAGDDAHRCGALARVIADPTVRAVLAARGGYGATRLLEHLSTDLVRGSPKLLVGFSDVTALHTLWARAGLRSLHGTMVAGLGRGGPALFDRWCAAIAGAVPAPLSVEALNDRAGRVRGPLLGGNLALIAALVGTPYAPPLDGCVLFLEDVGERPYRVDRMLTTLRHAGVFARAAAVVVGAFTNCPPGPDGTTVDDVLRDHFVRVEIPAAGGVPAGHVDDNLELPLGAPVELDLGRATLTFLESAAAALT